MSGSVDWTERYRPTSLDDVVGNSSSLDELREWAQAWEEGTPSRKAVILAGEPGVGKTSAAHALASDMGWGVVEMNASEDRNADAVEAVATAGATNRSLDTSGTGDYGDGGGRQLVILDEADNLFGNADRGGLGAMVDTIRETGQPVVLICNDDYELKRNAGALRGLAKTIKFSKVYKRSIPKALRGVAEAEGIQVEPGVFEELAERADGDLRGAINDFQALAQGREEVTREDLDALGSRDAKEDIFDALKAVFYGSDVEEAREATWDLDETPEDLVLWIDENLPDIYRDPADRASAYQHLARADGYLGRTRSSQDYGLWSYASDLMTAGVCSAKTREPEGSRFQFPSWLKKMSSSRSARNTRDGLAGKIADAVHTSTEQARDVYIAPLRALANEDEDVAAAITAELDLTEAELAYLLDMGEDTKTVARIREAADEIQEERAAPDEAAFGRWDESEDDADEAQATLRDDDGAPDADEGDGEDGDDGDDGQASLTDF
jgi:replication factor C large subunit